MKCGGEARYNIYNDLVYLSLTEYQAYLEFPFYLLSSITFLVLSILFLCRKKAKHIRTEALLLTLHYTLYLGLLLWRLNPWPFTSSFFGKGKEALKE